MTRRRQNESCAGRSAPFGATARGTRERTAPSDAFNQYRRGLARMHAGGGARLARPSGLRRGGPEADQRSLRRLCVTKSARYADRGSRF